MNPRQSEALEERRATNAGKIDLVELKDGS